LPYATEEGWIHRPISRPFVLPKEREASDQVKDERRLFYMSITRAKKHVCITFSNKDAERNLLPLRFIDELEEAHLLRIKTPAITKKIKTDDSESIKLNETKEQIEYAKYVLLENGLSVTALNHFLNCPSEFFYKSILKLPEPPNPSSEKGNAMHRALSYVWQEKIQEKNKDGKKLISIIQNTVKEYFRHSFLPLFEKEAIVEELVSNAPKVAASLKNHFSQAGVIYTENWVKAPFEYIYKKEKISINLHGKLDLLVERGNTLSVFDYKTRESLSPAAIKGQTKGSDGSYFRQLIFYQILLDGSKFKGKSIEPALVFVKPDRNGKCSIVSLPVNKDDIKKVKEEIDSLIESVWSGSLLTSTCNDKNCKYCGYRKLLDS
jgi:DNA helicase-2/ATP-dependent DNA helicase PcrA